MKCGWIWCIAGSERVDQMLLMILSCSMFVGGLLACLLDNLIPGH